MKTILACLQFLLTVSATFAQTVQHPLKVKVNVDNSTGSQQIKAPFLVALGNNPHYTIVDSDWDIEVTFTCAALKGTNIQITITGFACAIDNYYADVWGITYDFGIRLMMGDDEYIARSILVTLIEDTTPESLQKARELTETIANRVLLSAQ